MFKKLIFFILIYIFLSPAFIFCSDDIFDITGNKVFTGDELFYFRSSSTLTGGGSSNSVNMDRFFRDWGGEVTLNETINDKEYELKLGRFTTYFSLLTLQKTRFRYGWPGDYYNWGAYGRWEWDWGRWWDQRGIKVSVSDKEDELIALVAKTEFNKTEKQKYWIVHSEDYVEEREVDIPGGKVEWWDNHRMFADKYFMGIRKKIKFMDQYVGFNWVNEHYTAFKTGAGGEKSIPLQGDIPRYPTKEIILRFKDDSQVDKNFNYDGSGARVYSIKVYINGQYRPEFDVEKGIPKFEDYVNLSGSYIENTDSIEANGNTEAKYIFRLFFVLTDKELNEIKDVTFYIDVSGDYLIETARERHGSQKSSWDVDYPWETDYNVIYRADGNPRDYSNRKVITYHYGEYTGTDLFSIDMKGICPGINAPYTAEYANSMSAYKYPNTNGKVTIDYAKAYYAEIAKNIFTNLKLIFKYYSIDNDYNGDFAVEDNDDKDDLPDIVDADVPDNRFKLEGFDYDDDWFLFENDREYLDGWDFNNNGIYDDLENDNESDYFFPKGETGIRLLSRYYPIKNLSVYGVHIRSDLKVSDRKNKMDILKTKYLYEFKKSKQEFIYSIKRVKDTIQDDYLTHNTNLNSDNLRYRDNLIHTFMTSYFFKGINNLDSRVRFKIIKDEWRYVPADVTEGNFIFAVSYYKFYPFKKIDLFSDKLKGLEKWNLIPKLKIERQYSLLDYQTYREDAEDWRKDAVALILRNRLTKLSSIFIGAQLLFQHDYKEPVKSRIRTVFEIQFTHYRKDFKERPIYILASMKFINQSSDYKDNVVKDRIFYLRSFFNW